MSSPQKQQQQEEKTKWPFNSTKKLLFDEQGNALKGEARTREIQKWIEFMRVDPTLFSFLETQWSDFLVEPRKISHRHTPEEAAKIKKQNEENEAKLAKVKKQLALVGMSLEVAIEMNEAFVDFVKKTGNISSDSEYSYESYYYSSSSSPPPKNKSPQKSKSKK